MRKSLLISVSALQILYLLISVNLTSATGQQQQEDKFLYTLPASERVTIQKNIEYRKIGDRSLKFDFYSLPASGASIRRPVIVFMNGFGSADLKESPIQVEWAKICAASGLAAITFQSHFDGQPGDQRLVLQSVSEDFDSLIVYLRVNQAKLGLDPNTVIVHASSGSVPAGLSVVMDTKRPFIKAAVIYYGSADIKEFRLDLPVFFVRSGLDQPNLMRQIDVLLGRALAANAPFEIVNHPGGQHPFEIGNDNKVSTGIIARTLEFIQRSISSDVQSSIRASMDEAAAGAALLNENWPDAVAGYAALAAARPQDNEIRRRYADALFGAKKYADAVREYEQALALGSWRKRDIAYPAAVASAKTGDIENTLKWVARLLNTPFNRAGLLTDPNFEQVRYNPQFRSLVENISK